MHIDNSDDNNSDNELFAYTALPGCRGMSLVGCRAISKVRAKIQPVWPARRPASGASRRCNLTRAETPYYIQGICGERCKNMHKTMLIMNRNSKQTRLKTMKKKRISAWYQKHPYEQVTPTWLSFKWCVNLFQHLTQQRYRRWMDDGFICEVWLVLVALIHVGVFLFSPSSWYISSFWPH